MLCYVKWLSAIGQCPAEISSNRLKSKYAIAATSDIVVALIFEANLEYCGANAKVSFFLIFIM